MKRHVQRLLVNSVEYNEGIKALLLLDNFCNCVKCNYAKIFTVLSMRNCYR